MPVLPDPDSVTQQEPGRRGAAARHTATVYVLIALLATAFLLYVAYDQPAVRAAVGPAGAVLVAVLPKAADHVLAVVDDVLAQVIGAVLLSSWAAFVERGRRRRRHREEDRSSATAPPAE